MESVGWFPDEFHRSVEEFFSDVAVLDRPAPLAPRPVGSITRKHRRANRVFPKFH